jgi:lipopolysaccharide export system permease protein
LSDNKNNIIRASNLENKSLVDLSIYQFDENNNFTKRIQADFADISSSIWKLTNVDVLDEKGQLIVSKLSQATYASIYDFEKIQSLYANKDTVSFWKIGKQIKLLEERGYSTKQMETKLHRSLAFPFFLLSMVLLSGVFTLGINFKENNLTYIIITIITCILVYFFNDFSAALGETERLSIEIAVWMPIVIIFIFSSVGMIYANQK